MFLSRECNNTRKSWDLEKETMFPYKPFLHNYRTLVLLQKIPFNFIIGDNRTNKKVNKWDRTLNSTVINILCDKIICRLI